MQRDFINHCKNIKAFTLIEFAIVMVVSGILLIGGIQIAKIYYNDRIQNEMFERLNQADLALSAYLGNTSRYPCPASPVLPNSDPNAGVELSGPDCAALRDVLTPIGTCIDGVCKITGQRDTDADADILADPILIGAYPFKSIRRAISSSIGFNQDLGNTQNSIDPFGFNITYAISAYMTDPGLIFNPNYGVLAVRTETGASIIDPANSAHYVLVSHGRDNKGARAINGNITVPCAINTGVDVENCDNDSIFIAGLKNDVRGVNYFDDMVMYRANQISEIWRSENAGSYSYIYNLNPGNVGVGTSTPQDRLDINGELKAINVHVDELCDRATGTNCFSPDLLGGPTGLVCPPSGIAGQVNVLSGIANNTAICTSVSKPAGLAGKSCTVPGEYMVGVDNLGNLICE
jgi:type II secretory pathway pseudopilin PulG